MLHICDRDMYGMWRQSIAVGSYGARETACVCASTLNAGQSDPRGVLSSCRLSKFINLLRSIQIQDQTLCRRSA